MIVTKLENDQINIVCSGMEARRIVACMTLVAEQFALYASSSVYSSTSKVDLALSREADRIANELLEVVSFREN